MKKILIPLLLVCLSLWLVYDWIPLLDGKSFSGRNIPSTDNFDPSLTEDWIPMFDGRSLSGWSVKCVDADAEKQYWSVEDGVIQCDSIGNLNKSYVWLQYDQEFQDFELRLKFRAFRYSPGNSGVQFRSRYDPAGEPRLGGWLDGPQVDIAPGEPYRNGLLYDETRTEKRWLDPSLPSFDIKPEDGPDDFIFRYADEGNGWNDMRIKCVGTKVQTWVNGLKVLDYDGEGLLNDESHRQLEVGMHGYIALQLHIYNELKIHFKDLYIREM